MFDVRASDRLAAWRDRRTVPEGRFEEVPHGDPYGLLGVPRGASQEDVRRAYRKLVRQHHPDANPEDPAAEERFKEIQAAYETLSDPKKRREHDERARSSTRKRSTSSRKASSGGTRRQNVGSVDLSDLLSNLGDVSSRTGGRKEVNWQLRGEDLARVAKVLGLDITRISKLLGENIKANTKVSFGNRPTDGSRKTSESAASGMPPKPRKPPKPNKPPKTRKPRDV